MRAKGEWELRVRSRRTEWGLRMRAGVRIRVAM